MIRPKPRTRRRLLSPGQRAEIGRLVLEEGMSVRAVAHQFDISWSAADYWVRKAARGAKSAPKQKQQQGAAFSLPVVDISDDDRATTDEARPNASEQVADTPAACEKPADPSISAACPAEPPERSSPDYLVALLSELIDERDFLRALVRQLLGIASQPEASTHD